MPGWIRIILLAASLGRWRINIIPCVNTSFSSSWHCWRAMGWGYFKGGFWELFVTIQQQGEELFMGCRNSLYNEVFWPKPLPTSSPVPPISMGWGRTSLDPSRHQYQRCGSGDKGFTARGPKGRNQIGAGYWHWKLAFWKAQQPLLAAELIIMQIHANKLCLACCGEAAFPG